ncbi:MAG: LSM domain-containing protein [Candidatus Woesearchaeota archaeon]
MEQSRPLDALNKSRNKRIIVELKNGKRLVGNLESFDIHINIVMNSVEEFVDNELKRKLGTTFVRGDTIILITPAEQ